MNSSALANDEEGIAMANNRNENGKGFGDKALGILDEIQAIIEKGMLGLEAAPGLCKAKGLVKVMQGTLQTALRDMDCDKTPQSTIPNTKKTTMPPPPEHWYKATRRFRRLAKSWKPEHLRNGIRTSGRTALKEGEEKLMGKKEALTILVESQQWVLTHAPQLMGLVEAVKALTGSWDILAGGRAMLIPNWICYLAKAVEYMMTEQKQLERDRAWINP